MNKHWLTIRVWILEIHIKRSYEPKSVISDSNRNFFSIEKFLGDA